MPEEISPIFTKLCDVEIGNFRHGRVLLAARVIILFRVDRGWAERHLLPLFDWEKCEAEARVAWKGFLWSPRLHRPLMEKIKRPFLDTASHCEDLGRHGTQYASLLMYIALDHGATFSQQELKTATAALPEDGLEYIANALWRALDGAGEQRVEYWSNRVRPYLQSVWPKSLNRKTQKISESLGIVCVAAQGGFPDALDKLKHWLQPLHYPGHLMRRLNDSGLCSQFPEPALDFLHRVTSDTPPWGEDLGKCLNQIRSTKPELEDHQQFRKLRDLLHQYGEELE